MEFIIEFYKGLDTLNLIIFWGIIIVIVLLLIFSFVLINKNKKLKNLVEKNNRNEEDLPIKKEELTTEKNIEENNKKDNIILSTINEEVKEQNKEQVIISKPIETEKQFVAEEHVMEYNKDMFPSSNIKKVNELKEEKSNYEVKVSSTIKIPTEPYQRNVLREMSLSQTSPIGITKPVQKEDKKIESAKDLEDSLNKESEILQEEQTNINKEISHNNESKKELINNEKQHNNEINKIVKKELNKIEITSPRKTEVRTETQIRTRQEQTPTIVSREEPKIISTIHTDIIRQESTAKELLDIEPRMPEKKTIKTSSEKYLEEVSRKLAEAEIPDEIERTNYELKQEEDAIISYKELMEKKDSIQTIDEEEAVISIEELMNRSKQKEEKKDEDTKLYRLNEEEENDNFIKELKQFRNDL